MAPYSIRQVSRPGGSRDADALSGGRLADTIDALDRRHRVARAALLRDEGGDVLDPDDPLLRVALKEAAAQAELDRAPLERGAVRSVIGIPLEANVGGLQRMLPVVFRDKARRMEA